MLGDSLPSHGQPSAELAERLTIFRMQPEGCVSSTPRKKTMAITLVLIMVSGEGLPRAGKAFEPGVISNLPCFGLDQLSQRQVSLRSPDSSTSRSWREVPRDTP